MINRLLVANRAEIASRVFRTCRSLGIETVAIHSDADADLPFVREADQAVHLPGSTPAETYLRIDLIIDAARATGADAVHPGYGFLSENADFARSVEDAGLTWIGPTPASIDAMGSKIRAKEIMRAAGVPVLPTWTGSEIGGRVGLDTPARSSRATRPPSIETPLLVKASAGGGGRGMRVVRRLEDLPGEIAKAEAEALSAFGDGTVFVEPYVERGRHVEVQVVGLGHSGAQVYGERDCSLQRRHQKVVEESPAPRLPDATRAALHEAAREAAEAIDYRGAGTVEFLYDAEADRFFFLEMNTRLQVEHPVTELVHGVDLVALQIAVAEGRPVPAPEPPVGHAIEVRLYAEDPAADYQPQSGTLTTFEIPLEDGIRVDAGFGSGSEVSTHYDAMLAKVIAHADSREGAARKLASVLSRARIHGLVTNRDLLVQVLRDPEFLSGDVSTDFLGRDAQRAPERTVSITTPSAVAAAIALAERAREARTVQRGAPVAWRNVVSQPQRTVFDETTVEWFGGRGGYTVADHTVVDAGPASVTLETDGVRTTYRIDVNGAVVDVDSARGHARLTRVPRFVDPAEQVASGSLLAPMPGTVVSVAVEAGQQVAAGQPVLVLEAMKMQHTVSAPHAGTVAQIEVKPGAQVAAGEVLAVVEEAE